MTHEEWIKSWTRIKERFSSWQPTQTEAEDFCMGLRVYSAKMVEEVGQWVVQNYSSKEPKLAWYIRQCEARKKEMAQANEPDSSLERQIENENFDVKRKRMMARLEETPVEDLRKGLTLVLQKYGNILTKPDSPNPKEWKVTIRALVHLVLYGGEDD